MVSEPGESDLLTTTPRILQIAVGILLMYFGLAGILSSSQGFVRFGMTIDALRPLAVLLLAITLILSGLFVLPHTRRRLKRYRGLDQFGYLESTNTHTAALEENEMKTCVVCSSKSGEGIIREYNKDLFLVGVPIWNKSGNSNFYCEKCAETESMESNRPLNQEPSSDDILTERS